MVKMYEILFFISFIIFIVYTNIPNSTNNTKTFSSNVALVDNTLDLDCMNFNDPCLCIKISHSTTDNTANTSIDDVCFQNELDLEPYLINTSFDIDYNTPNDITFHNLINSSYQEYYYAKLMEITQISYMHYYHTDGLLDGTQNNNTRKTPHYLLFLAIEHLKRSEYDLSIEYLNKFINIPIDYNKNKDKFYFYGCCPRDLNWVKDKNHKSYTIAYSLKESIEVIKSFNNNKTEFTQVIESIDNLRKYDKTPKTIDFIENIIFSLLLSMENITPFIKDYKIKLLDNYDNIQIDSFSEPFSGVIGNFMLSSQIDIMIMLKLIQSEKLITSLISNNKKNSLYDIQALRRYNYLKNIYFSNEDSTKIYNMASNELKYIKDEITSLESASMAQKDIDDLFDSVIDYDNINKKKLKKIKKQIFSAENILQNFNIKSLDRPISFSNISLLNNKYDYFTLSHYIVDYSNFDTNVDSLVNLQSFPIINNKYKEVVRNIITGKNYMAELENNIYQYHNDSNDGKTNINYSDYIGIFLYSNVLKLNGKGIADNIVHKINNNVQSYFSKGHELLIRSIDYYK